MPTRSWPRWVLGGFLVAGLAVAVLLSSDRSRREAKRWVAERAGDVAAQVVQGGGDSERAADLINVPVAVRKLANSVYQAAGVGNVQLIATPEGHVVFDTGLVIQAAKQRRLLAEAIPDGPITHVILSHSHQDHIGGTQFFVEEGTEIVAHQEFPEEQRYLNELQPYLWSRNRTLFPWMPESPPKIGFVARGIQPTLLVDDPDPYRFEQGGIRFEVIPSPGAEGADNLVLWLPDEKILFSGDFFGPIFPQFPNVFTMRGEKVRKPIEYIESLERIIALEPEMVVPSHRDPVTGKEEIRAAIVKMRDAVRYVHDATVAGMNAGKTVHELMAEIELPPELVMTQAHGRVSWAVKSIWEYYATWFHFDRTTELYPVPQEAILDEVVELAGIQGLIDRARRHVEAGRPIHALHLMEIALGGQPTHRGALEARLEALGSLLEQARPLNNSYEMDWLSSRIRVTEEALARDAS
ncbi:MAG: MBL fold metallo-hydrolase [Deltaproteobacteria bacterium]|nr:MBL fold metallo-hydrolase [Deltaproteobacteria bacterium]